MPWQLPTFQQIDAELGESRINGLFQDHQGYLWVATEDGLFRFDGFQFEPFGSNVQTDSSSSTYRINQVFEDSKKQLWVATDNAGLAWFDRVTQRLQLISHTHSDYKLPSNRITKITEDQAGNLWVGTGKGVTLIDAQRTNASSLSNKISIPFESAITEVMEDSNGRIWIASVDSLYIFYPDLAKLKQPLLEGPSDSIQGILKIFEDSKKRIWIGTANSGVFVLSMAGDDAFTSSRVPELADLTATDLAEDTDGNLWVTTEAGLYLINGESLSIPNLRDQDGKVLMPSTNLSKLYLDKKDRVWLGSNFGDLIVYDPNRIRFNYLPGSSAGDGLPVSQVNAFYYKNEREIWLGTDGGGITIWNRADHKFSYYQDSPNDQSNIGTNAILDFQMTNDGYLWFSSWAGGLRKFDLSRKQFITYRDPNYNTFPFNETYKWNIFDVEEDSKANLWVAHYYGGILRIPSSQEADLLYILAHSRDADDVIQISDPNIFSVELENDSVIWVGTKDGLNKIELSNDDSYEVVQYFYDENDTSSISSSEITTIFVDSKKRTWIGTPAGLNLYEKASDGFLKYSDELPDLDVRGIIEDNIGDLWIATAKGLCMMSETVSGDFRFRNYLKSDGLPEDEFRRGAIYLSSEGEIYLGAKDGIIYFLPSEVAGNPYKLTVQFSDIKVLGESASKNGILSDSTSSIDEIKEIVLNHDQSLVTIEFFTISLTEPEKNEYAYLLKGFDADWNYIGGQQSVTFTDLAPGEYLLRIKAANNDGVWNHQEEKTLKIVVLPPWWASGWFNALLILAVALAVYWLYLKNRSNELSSKDDSTQADSAERTPRLHSLDSMRAIMMLLGLVLHGALFYFPSTSDFPVDPNSQNPALFYLTSLIHQFRMPGFYLVSGFFGALLYYEKGAKEMIKNRWARIALPFLIFLPFIHLVQSAGFTVAWLGSTSQSLELDFSKLIVRILPTQTMHLWFLYYLFFFSLILFGISYLYRKNDNVNRRIRTFYNYLFRNKIVALIILSLVYGSLMQLLDVFHAHQSDISSFNPLTPSFVLFFFFYLNGWLLYSIRGHLPEFRFGPILLLLLVFFGIDTGTKELIEKSNDDNPNIKKTVTFQVDMRDIPLDTVPDFKGVFFHSSFLGWCEFCGNEMKDDDNDQVYSITYDVPVGFHNYIYSINGYMYYETPLDGHLTEDAVCRKEYRLSSRWNDYGLYVTSDQASLTTLAPVCYASCQTCDGSETLIVREPNKVLFSMAYNRFSNATYSVLLTYVVLSFFLMFLNKENRTMRYINDASYWVYLQHLWLLPVFAGLLMAFKFPVTLKLIFIVLATVTITFLSYHTMVRYTFIGKLLNGKKHQKRS